METMGTFKHFTYKRQAHWNEQFSDTQASLPSRRTWLPLKVGITDRFNYRQQAISFWASLSTEYRQGLGKGIIEMYPFWQLKETKKN